MFIRNKELQRIARENYENGMAAQQPTITSLREEIKRVDEMGVALYKKIGELTGAAEFGQHLSDLVAQHLSKPLEGNALRLDRDELVEALIESTLNLWHYEEMTAETQRTLSVDAQVEAARLLGARLLREARQLAQGDKEGNVGYAAVLQVRGNSFP